ncbi:MAG: avirulence protein [Sphingobium sp.]|nr:avirulence protein [Sphingobium sp.]
MSRFSKGPFSIAIATCLLHAPVSTAAEAQAASPAVASDKIDQHCVAGAWRVPAPDPDDTANAPMPVRMESQHFALRWLDAPVDRKDAQAALDHLEYVWDYFNDIIGFPTPYCDTPTKYKANIFIGKDYGLSAGMDGKDHMGIWVGPGALKDRFGLAHEFTHAQQGATGRYRDTPYAGWMWESIANFMALQLPEFRNSTHCSVFQVNYPHLYYGTTRMRYCNIQLWEYLKNRFGYSIITDLMRNAPPRHSAGEATADPFIVLMQSRGWSIAQFNDIMADWAMHNANWDYKDPDGTDHGAVFRANYGGYEPYRNDAPLRTTMLDPMDMKKRRFSVPEAWAPQRWGYNLVRLHADTGAKSIGVTFRGVVQDNPATQTLPGLADEPTAIPQPDSDWRWGVVSVGADGSSRYSALQTGARGDVTVDVRPDDSAHYLMVMGTPSKMHQIRWDQPYYSIYRYPWMVELRNALPEGFQPNAPAPIAGAHRHPNGGGWVGPQAQVAPSAFVGPYARVEGGTVSDQARIEDHAVVLSGEVRDQAVVGALSVIRGNTIVKDRARVMTSFLGIGEYEKGIVLSGDTQLIGDAEERGASLSGGVYYGFVDAETAADPKRGANLSAPVPEVTALARYKWKP